MGIWDFVKEQKEKGRIKHWGFSFHGSPELLEELLTKHPDAEFVQLQINYADWENPEVKSRICYEIVRKHGKSVVIMEPIKGGKLANPNDNVKAIFDSYGSDASYASWAIRYAASLDGVIAVLSGMSNIAQMADNVSYMKEFKPLNAGEREVIRKVQEELNKVESVPCTGCHYCTDGCPMGVHIPEIFVALNLHLAGKKEEAQEEYDRVTAEGGKASECIQCGQCEGVCPQSIPVIANLQKAAELFE
jgi:predicted aldo/keto reductase-like oxidoreductase